MATSSWQESPPFPSQTVLTPLCPVLYQSWWFHRCSLNSLDSFSKTETAKYHRLDGLNNRNLSVHGSGGWKFKIEETLAGWFPSEGLSPLLVGGHPLPISYRGPHTMDICVHTASSRQTILRWIRLILKTSVDIMTSLKTLSPPLSHSDTLRVSTCDARDACPRSPTCWDWEPSRKWVKHTLVVSEGCFRRQLTEEGSPIQKTQTD